MLDMEKLLYDSEAIETDFGTMYLNKQNNNKTIVVLHVCFRQLRILY